MGTKAGTIDSIEIGFYFYWEGRFVLFPFILAGLVLATAAGVLLELAKWQIVWAGLLLWAAGILASLLLYALVLLIVSLFLPTDRPPKRDHPLS